MSPDLAARKLIMSAYLYYRCDTSVLSDGDYDKLSLFVADSWEQLSEQLQWQLGDREGIRATGIGILITQMGQDAAHSWLHREKKETVRRGLQQPFLDKIAGSLVENPGDYIGPHPKYGCYYAVI